MDREENKMGLKRKPQHMEMLIDSGDDEPIGALLKLKGKKNSKKAKVVSDGSENKVKGVRKMATEDEELGGMDDTLANFRKKLRGPRKDGGSQELIGKDLSNNLSEPSCQSMNESAKVGELDSNMTLEFQEKDSVNGVCGSSWDATAIEDLKVKAKRKNKRSKLSSEAKIVARGAEFDDGPDRHRSENCAPHGEKEDGSEPGDEVLEDSLSTLFQKVQKVQSSMIWKSRNSSRWKQGKGTQVFDDGSRPNSVVGSEDPVVKSRNTSKLTKNFLESDDRSDVVPGQGSIKSTLIHGTTDDCLPEVLNCTPGTPSATDQIMRSSVNMDGAPFKVISGNSASISLVERSHSSLKECSGKISGVQDGEINSESIADLPGSNNEPPSSNNSLDRSCEVFHSVETKNNCLLPPHGSTLGKTCDKEVPRDHLNSHVSDTPTVMPCIKKLLAKKCKDESKTNPKPYHGLPEGTCPLNSDYPSGDEELNGTSYSPVMLDHQGSCPEETGSLDDPETKEISISGVQRAARNAKKCRHEDMAYEGDADWEILIQGQEFLVTHGVVDRTREKLNSSTALDTENGKAAAVSAGLKARAVGPIEKIKFKEVLKRKGGLQEYLECRNHILSVWNKDVSRILPLADFGVSDSPLEGESQRTFLIRDVYTFLDQCGYVNFGVPSEKEKVENSIKHDLKLLTEDKFGETARPPVADSEDGVSFILGKEKTSIGGMNGDAFPDDKLAGKGPVNLQALESSSLNVSEGCPPNDRQGISYLDSILPKEVANMDHLGSIPSFKDDPSCKNEDVKTPPPVHLESLSSGETVPGFQAKLPKQSSAILSGFMDHTYDDIHSDSRPKKNIIIVGAGPAGLTAARHLQRHGFNVTVLEARSRIGGRVFTDRSSLSVPVDLGASIITGVEADVATERRPDPSSLICAQLGLELTVLNSDCPLYDTVTGQKVPADLDETLEAEYNSLLDDMVLLVAEKGEHAMKMSLEEGLEYGLKRCRVACSGQDGMEITPVKSQDTFVAGERFTTKDEILKDQGYKTVSLNPLERRVMDWHFANLEYGCAALLKDVSLPNWNQDDVYGGFGGAHCMIKGGYSAVVESLGEGLCIYLDHVVIDISYNIKDSEINNDLHSKVKVSTSNGKEFSGDAVLVTVPLGCLKAETIKFSPPLPEWKYLSVKRLGFGVLNKVVLEFPEVFWDETIDYFGATAEVTAQRGRCFMFWNVKKTVGAPVLIALVVGMAAIEGQNISSSDQVNNALLVLRKLFGEDKVSDPVASVVTDWGRDPYSYGAYSYVAVGSSGEDYDILGRPVENCLFFAGEATCKEHPDTVGGAMMSGLREAVRIMDILNNGTDYTAVVEAMEAARRHSDIERSEIRDIIERLDALEFSLSSEIRDSTLKDMFFIAKTSAGRLHLAKELLNLPVGFLKTFASTKEGLSVLNSWILDSLGKDGTQLLRHCVRLLVLVSTDLLAVRSSGIGKTVQQKVCVHTSRDIRAIASQLVHVWVELFRKEKASKGGLKLLRLSTTLDSKGKSSLVPGKPPLRTPHVAPESKGSSKVSASAGQFPSTASTKKVADKTVKLETRIDLKSDLLLSNSHGSIGSQNVMEEENHEIPMSEEEEAAFAAAEAARAAAIAAAKAFSSGATHKTLLQPPKILSFHKFAMREQHAHMDESDSRRNWSGPAIGRQDCLSDIDSRNCRVRDWSVDFSAAGVNLENSRMSFDNRSQRSHSNEIASQLNFREHSGESAAVDSSIFTKAWVDSAGSVGIKDYSAIDRWQSQAAAASSGFSHGTMHATDEEDSNLSSKLPEGKHCALANESSASHVTLNRESKGNQARGAERIKQAVVDYVASLLMPLYKARKIDREGYKSIMKKTATKVMEQTNDAEKAMTVFEFLDFKRKNKIRAFVDRLIERHMAMQPDAKLGSSKND